jgi:hypothetical protein
VNIGVTSALIPFAKTDEPIYHAEAFAGTLTLNIFFIFSKSKFPVFLLFLPWIAKLQ